MSARVVSPPLPKAFTLLELLATTAIIAVLAALLIPAIGKMQNSARAASDLAGLRQIGQAMIGYAGDNQNKINQRTTSSPQDVWPDLFWVRASPYLGTALATDGSLTVAQVQTVANKFPNKMLSSLDPRYVGTFASAIQPFAFNNRLFNWHAPPAGAGKSSDHFRRLTEFSLPASTPYVAVGKGSFSSGTPGPMPDPSASYSGVLWPYPGRQTLVVYLDGHAAVRTAAITEDDCWGGIPH